MLEITVAFQSLLRHTMRHFLRDFGGRSLVERISLSAFFPAYNDQYTIEGIVRTAAAEMSKYRRFRSLGR